VAGLRPDPLGELKRSPDPLAAIRGAYFEGEGKGGEGKGGEGKGKGGEGEWREKGNGRGNLLQGVGGDRRP